MASSTRAAVAGRTPSSSLTTRETVFRLTPALLATSRIVGLATLSSLLSSDPDSVVTTLSGDRRHDPSRGMTTMSRGARYASPWRGGLPHGARRRCAGANGIPATGESTAAPARAARRRTAGRMV